MEDRQLRRPPARHAHRQAQAALRRRDGAVGRGCRQLAARRVGRQLRS